MIRIKKIFLTVVICWVEISCNRGKSSGAKSSGNLLQRYIADSVNIALITEDQGAFGSTVVMKILAKENNKLIEEIGLRGGDYLPKIYNVSKDTIYIRYQYPGNENEKRMDTLAFESVVLGPALLRKESLKYKYIFINLNPSLDKENQ